MTEYITKEQTYNIIVNNYDEEDMLRELDAIPAADVVEVVRCEYCAGRCWCNFRQWLGEHGYCSRGWVKGNGDE